MSGHQKALKNAIDKVKEAIKALDNLEIIYLREREASKIEEHDKTMRIQLQDTKEQKGFLYLKLVQLEEDLHELNRLEKKGGRKNGKRKSKTMKGRNKKGKKGSRMVLKSSRKTSRKR